MRIEAVERRPAGLVDASARNWFIPTDLPRPHPLRRRAILAAHPDVETLIGHDPITALITLAVVIGQVLIAALFGYLGFLLLVGGAHRCFLHRRLRQSRHVRRHPRRDPQLHL